MMKRRTLLPIELPIDASLIRLYAELTDDHNPIHLDEAFAATTLMGGVVAHGTMAANLVLHLAERHFGTDAMIGTSVAVRYALPVRPGDVLRAGLRPVGTGSYEAWVTNACDERVIEATMRFALGPH